MKATLRFIARWLLRLGTLSLLGWGVLLIYRYQVPVLYPMMAFALNHPFWSLLLFVVFVIAIIGVVWFIANLLFENHKKAQGKGKEITKPAKKKDDAPDHPKAPDKKVPKDDHAAHDHGKGAHADAHDDGHGGGHGHGMTVKVSTVVALVLCLFIGSCVWKNTGRFLECEANWTKCEKKKTVTQTITRTPDPVVTSEQPVLTDELPHLDVPISSTEFTPIKREPGMIIHFLGASFSKIFAETPTIEMSYTDPVDGKVDMSDASGKANEYYYFRCLTEAPCTISYDWSPVQNTSNTYVEH